MAFATLMSLVGSNLGEAFARTMLTSQGFDLDHLEQEGGAWFDEHGDAPVLINPDQGLVFEIDTDGRIAKFVVIGLTEPDSGIVPHRGVLLGDLTIDTPRIEIWLALGERAGHGETRAGHPWDIWIRGDLSFRFVYGNTAETETTIMQVVVQPTHDVMA